MQSLLLVAAAIVAGDVPLKVPEEVKGKPGLVYVKAETSGVNVRWVLLDPGPSFIPPEFLKDPRVAVVFCLEPGRYRLLAYTGKGDEVSEPAITTLVIEGKGPNPTPPGPIPPGPTPPPSPPDPLVAKFQAAFSADASPAKAAALTSLVGLYQAMAEHTRDDRTLTTLGDVLGDLQRTAKRLNLPAEALVELRKQIAAEVAATIGTNPSLALDAALRSRAVDAFTKIAEALGKVK